MTAVLDARDAKKTDPIDRSVGRIMRALRARADQETVITNVNIVFQGYGTGLITFKGVCDGTPVCLFAGFSMGDHEFLEALERGWRREGTWKTDQWPGKAQRMLTENAETSDEDL